MMLIPPIVNLFHVYVFLYVFTMVCFYVFLSLSPRLSHHRGRDARGERSIHRGDTADLGGGREPTSGDVRPGESLY